MNETTARRTLGIALPAATIAAIVVPYLALRSELPDRIATHFDGSGTPDGSMTPAVFLLVVLILSGVGLVGLVWLAWSKSPLPQSVSPTVGFLGGFFAGLGAGIMIVTLISQRGIDDWTEASDVWALIAVPTVLGAAIGAAAAWLAGQLPHREGTHVPAEAPTMELADGQVAVWTETLHSKWLMRFGIIAAVGGVVVAAGTFWWLALPALVTGLAMTSLATLRVRADRTGLSVRYGVLPWPRTHIETAEIQQATVIDVKPMEWGGWGYRGSLRLMNQAAVVHRAGPGLRLDLTGDRRFVVTVDQPQQPAALLNAEVARASSAAS